MLDFGMTVFQNKCKPRGASYPNIGFKFVSDFDLIDSSCWEMASPIP